MAEILSQQEIDSLLSGISVGRSEDKKELRLKFIIKINKFIEKNTEILIEYHNYSRSYKEGILEILNVNHIDINKLNSKKITQIYNELSIEIEIIEQIVLLVKQILDSNDENVVQNNYLMIEKFLYNYNSKVQEITKEVLNKVINLLIQLSNLKTDTIITIKKAGINDNSSTESIKASSESPKIPEIPIVKNSTNNVPNMTSNNSKKDTPNDVKNELSANIIQLSRLRKNLYEQLDQVVNQLTVWGRGTEYKQFTSKIYRFINYYKEKKFITTKDYDSIKDVNPDLANQMSVKIIKYIVFKLVLIDKILEYYFIEDKKKVSRENFKNTVDFVKEYSSLTKDAEFINFISHTGDLLTLDYSRIIVGK